MKIDFTGMQSTEGTHFNGRSDVGVRSAFLKSQIPDPTRGPAVFDDGIVAPSGLPMNVTHGQSNGRK